MRLNDRLVRVLGALRDFVFALNREKNAVRNGDEGGQFKRGSTTKVKIRMDRASPRT